MYNNMNVEVYKTTVVLYQYVYETWYLTVRKKYHETYMNIDAY
jgi:hypothetical protein